MITSTFSNKPAIGHGYSFTGKQQVVDSNRNSDGSFKADGKKSVQPGNIWYALKVYPVLPSGRKRK